MSFDMVIVAFDGSERGLDALMLADALVGPGGELVVCCVHHLQPLSARIDSTEPRVDEQTAEQTLAEATMLLRGGARVTPIFVSATSTASALHDVAAERQADLLVLGSSHRGALGRVLLGSVSRQTIHAGQFPVAIAPNGFHRRHRYAVLQRIAVGYDVFEPVAGAVPAAVALCDQSAAELVLVAVADDRTVSNRDRASMSRDQISTARLRTANQALEALLADLPASVRASGEARYGDPAEQLLEQAREVDLLVLASHGRGLIGRLGMGSVSDAVVHAAECAVLVVPPSEIPDCIELERWSARQAVKADVAALSFTTLSASRQQSRRAPDARF